MAERTGQERLTDNGGAGHEHHAVGGQPRSGEQVVALTPVEPPWDLAVHVVWGRGEAQLRIPPAVGAGGSGAPASPPRPGAPGGPQTGASQPSGPVAGGARRRRRPTAGAGGARRRRVRQHGRPPWVLVVGRPADIAVRRDRRGRWRRRGVLHQGRHRAELHSSACTAWAATASRVARPGVRAGRRMPKNVVLYTKFSSTVQPVMAPFRPRGGITLASGMFGLRED